MCLNVVLMWPGKKGFICQRIGENVPAKINMSKLFRKEMEAEFSVGFLIASQQTFAFL